VDKVIIRDLVARGVIGVNDWERERPQDIRINITAYTDTRNAAGTDDLHDCVDYRALAKRAREHAETAHRFTVEALDGSIS
jgi:FolB domain-containing protein